MFSNKYTYRPFPFSRSSAVLVLILLLWAHPVAAAGGAGVTAGGNIGETTLMLADFLSVVVTVMHILLLTALKIASYLLSSQFFLEPNMMSILKNIWLLSRDIVNVIFAFMLIGAAFMTIVTGDSSLIKERIVKFVMAVILVNFSWFFPRVIIDVSSILTATVYSIPNMLPSYTCKFAQDQPPNFVGPPLPPQECRGLADFEIFPDATKVQQFLAQCSADDVNKGNCDCNEGISCTRTATLSEIKQRFGGSHAILSGLAVSFAKITTLTKVPKSDVGAAIAADPTNGPSRILQLLISIAFAVMIQVFVTFPIIALTVALLVRIVILWVTIAFMPFSFIGYAINGKLGTAVFGNETDIWGEFIKAAFLPTTVAVPLVIGLVMVSSTSTIVMPNNGIVMDLPIVSGISNWWSMLWVFAACMIIWEGTFGALSKGPKMIGGITEKIKGVGTTIGTAAARLPLLAPLPFQGPGGSGNPMNIGTAIANVDAKLKGITTFRPSVSGLGNANPAIENALKDTGAASVVRLNQINDTLNRIAATNDKATAETHIATLRTHLGADPTMTNTALLDELRRVKINGAAGVDLTAVNKSIQELERVIAMP